MNRTELCARIAARSSLSRADAATALDAVVSAIADALERGEVVNNLSGFGRFAASHGAPRQGRDPRPHRADVQARQGPSRQAQRPVGRA